MTRLEQKIAKLKKMFPSIEGIREGEGWGANKGSIHLGNAAEGGEIEVKAGGEFFKVPAADYWGEFGYTIHSKLEKALGDIGYFAEWYDSGTLIAYPV